MEEPDPAAVRAATAGDLAAFEELVRLYQTPVWRFLSNLVGDAALAEDITQETFVSLYGRLGTFTFRSKFSTCVFQIARNAGVDALRRRGRRDRLARVLPRSRPAVSPEAHVELHLLVAELPERLREALLVVEIWGLSHREAAAVLEVPEGTVKSRLFRAREQLAAALDAQEATGEL